VEAKIQAVRTAQLQILTRARIREKIWEPGGGALMSKTSKRGALGELAKPGRGGARGSRIRGKGHCQNRILDNAVVLNMQVGGFGNVVAIGGREGGGY